MAVAWVEARLAHKTVWAPGLVTLRLDAAIEPFEAGQFAQLATDQEGRQVKRAYSYASAPGEAPEFLVTEVEQGALSPILCALDQGDPVRITPVAKGFFTLAECPDAEVLWLVATGTGLAPYISMLRTETPWARFPRVVLVHGVRVAAHLAYADELRALEASRPGRFAYQAWTSREGSRPTRLPNALAAGWMEAEGGAELRADNSHVLLCGNPEMIREMEGLLAERGLRRHTRKERGQITTERYW